MGVFTAKNAFSETKPAQGCIVGDKLYTINPGSTILRSSNLVTGEIKTEATLIKVASAIDATNGNVGVYCLIADKISNPSDPRVWIFYTGSDTLFRIACFNTLAGTIVITSGINTSFPAWNDTSSPASSAFLFGVVNKYSRIDVVINTYNYTSDSLYIRGFDIPAVVNTSNILTMFNNSFPISNLHGLVAPISTSIFHTTWYSNATYHFFHNRPAVVRNGDKLYFFGGCDIGNSTARTSMANTDGNTVAAVSSYCGKNVISYDINTGSVENHSSGGTYFPQNFDVNGVGFSVGDNIYLTGGIKFNATANGATNYTTSIYNTKTNSWSVGTSITQDFSSCGQMIYDEKYGNFAVGVNGIGVRFRYWLDAPTDVTATYNGGTQKIDLSWTDVSTEETEYYIEKSVNNAGWTELIKVPTNTQTYTDPNVVDISNNSYSYRIQARRLII